LEHLRLPFVETPLWDLNGSTRKISWKRALLSNHTISARPQGVFLIDSPSVPCVDQLRTSPSPHNLGQDTQIYEKSLHHEALAASVHSMYLCPPAPLCLHAVVGFGGPRKSRHISVWDVRVRPWGNFPLCFLFGCCPDFALLPLPLFCFASSQDGLCPLPELLAPFFFARCSAAFLLSALALLLLPLGECSTSGKKNDSVELNLYSAVI